MGSQANAFAWDPMGLDLGQSPVGAILPGLIQLW